MILRILFCLFAMVLMTSPGHSQDDTSPIIIIYDASGSMWGKMESSTKIEIARSVLSETVSSLDENQMIGLVAYGHRKEKDCKDVEWLVNYSNKDKAALSNRIKSINPKGRTPLARSAEMVFSRLKEDSTMATVVLITDGIESCDGDLCKVVQEAKGQGINFKLHIVGFGLVDQEIKTLRCAAKAGEGYYYEASNSEGLATALNDAVKSTVDKPKANFGFFTTRNGQSADAIVKCKKDGSTSLFLRTYGDTAMGYLEPGSYDVVVEILENSNVEPKTLKGIVVPDSGIIYKSASFDAGVISIETTLNGMGWDCMVAVKKQGQTKNIATSRTYGRKELIDLSPGEYDVTFTALKLDGAQSTVTKEKIVVNGGDTVTVSHDFQTGKVRIGASSAQGLVDASVKVLNPGTNKTVSSGRTYNSSSSNPKEFLVAPGTYNVELKALSLRGYDATVILKDIKVEAAQATDVNHEFQFGRLKVKVTNLYGLADATVKVIDKDGNPVTSGRTYTKESSNPKDFLLTPGKYQVEVKVIGKDEKGKKVVDFEITPDQTEDLEIKF